MTKMLEGLIVEDDPHEARIRELEDEIQDLRGELAVAKDEAALATRKATRAVGELRRQLLPLYRALQGVFGEIEAVGFDEPTSTGQPAALAQDPRLSAIWASWKKTLGPQCAKVIDALLLQPGMNSTQLGIAIQTRRQNITNLIYKMNQAGLIDKNGGRFSLKQL